MTFGNQQHQTAGLTAQRVRALLHYDSSTGLFIWRERSAEDFATDRAARSWNTRYSGSPALHTDRGNGYLQGQIDGHIYKAHRIAWLHHHGVWPKGDIDHINGDRADNRIENLRDVSRSVNLLNKPKAATNSSGVKGVSWAQERGQWNARIGVDGFYKNLGYFDCFDAAVQARLEAEAALGIELPNARST